MQRYHDTAADPLPQHRPERLDVEARRIEEATQAFLANGGAIQQVGFQMREKSQAFVINPERSPVYAHLFEPASGEQPRQADSAEATQVALVMARAALGQLPGFIAKKLHMTEARVRTLARDYHINFTRH